jgi:hypothetical protein
MDVDQGSAIVWSVVEFPALTSSQLERESFGVGARPARCGRVRFCLLPCFFCCLAGAVKVVHALLSKLPKLRGACQSLTLLVLFVSGSVPTQRFRRCPRCDRFWLRLPQSP